MIDKSSELIKNIERQGTTLIMLYDMGDDGILNSNEFLLRHRCNRKIPLPLRFSIYVGSLISSRMRRSTTIFGYFLFYPNMGPIGFIKIIEVTLS